MKLFQYLLGFIASLLVAIAISEISKMPSRFLFSIVLGALTFLIYITLLNVEQINTKRFNLQFKFDVKQIRSFFVPLLYAVSLIIVLMIPSISETQFVIWSSIPASNYARLLAGLMLSSILPGYGLLRLIDRKRNFNGLVSVVFSFFVSVFIMAMLSYGSIVLSVPSANIYWITIGFNLIIFIGLLLNTVKKKETVTNLRAESSTQSHRLDYLIIVCILLFFVVGWVIYYSSYQLGSTGDMWDHYYSFLHVSTGDLLSSPHLSYLNAEAWFSLHYLAVFQLTGFPSLNGWMVYAFINFFYVLAFYLMVRGIVGDKHPRVPVIATVIATLFAGFAWIVALLLAPNTGWGAALNIAGSMTYNDIIYSFIYGPIPQYFVLSVLFALLYLMVRKDHFSIVSVFLTAILVAQGLLVHSPEIIFFVLLYYLFLFCVNRENFGRLRNYSFSILLGLFAVFIIGLPFPSHFYFNMNVLLPILFVAIGFTLVIIHIRPKISYTFKTPRKTAILAISGVWILYILSFFAWNSTLSLNVTENLGAVGLKPWYIYPINSGMSLLLGLLGLTYIVLSNQSKLTNAKFLVISLISIFIVGKILSYANFNFIIGVSTYWEKRLYSSFMIIPLSIFGAYFIAELIPRLHFRQAIKKVRQPFFTLIAGLLISIIIVGGVGSNVLALDHISIASQSDPLSSCSKAELQALDYLKANASADATVLGLSTVSNRLAYVFSGMNHINSPYWFTSISPFQYVDITNPELALKVLYSLSLNYLFATKSDLETFQSNGYVVSHLLKYLPIAFQNSEVTIYQVPKLNPPSSNSNFTLAVPSYMFNASSNSEVGALVERTLYLPIDMLAQSGLDYSIKITEDGSLFNSKYLILPSDKDWTDEQISEYLAWVNNGGKLIVLNGDGLGNFAKQLSINSNSNEPLSVNEAVSKSATVDLGTLDVTSLFSTDDQVKVAANYINENNQSVPLAFSKQVGNGEILYVNVSPLFENLGSANVTSPINFQKMGSLFNLLSLDAPVFKDIPADLRWEYLGYDATSIRDYAQLKGSVNIESNSTILPYDQFNISTLALVNVTGMVNGLPITGSILLQNVAINGLLEKGAVHSVLKSQDVDMIPTDYGSYSGLLLDVASNISMQVPQEGITFSALASDNKTYKINLQSGIISMENISSTSIASTSNIFANRTLPNNIDLDNKIFVLTSVPSVSVNGTVVFPEAYIPSYIKNVAGDSVQINGNVHFNFGCSSDSVIVLTDFGYSGTFQTGQQTAKISMVYWEITAIPWASIFTYPLFIFCIAVIVTIFFVFKYSKSPKNFSE